MYRDVINFVSFVLRTKAHFSLKDKHTLSIVTVKFLLRFRFRFFFSFVFFVYDYSGITYKMYLFFFLLLLLLLLHNTKYVSIQQHVGVTTNFYIFHFHWGIFIASFFFFWFFVFFFAYLLCLLVCDLFE